MRFSHFRYTAVTRLAECGCSTPLISAITGHALKSVDTILERYLVRTREMARGAKKTAIKSASSERTPQIIGR